MIILLILIEEQIKLGIYPVVAWYVTGVEYIRVAYILLAVSNTITTQIQTLL